MTAPLSDRQRRVLAAVCDTLLPSIARDDDPHGLFAIGADAATVERVERIICSLRDPHDRTRVTLLLSALGSPLANVVLSGRYGSFATMSGATREAVLRRWAFSRVPLQRAGFQALKRLAHIGFLVWPLEDGSHPAWRAAGYPGPLPQPVHGVTPLAECEIDRDTVLDCDVVVVGAGAGGGVVAGVLASAGQDVVVLEKGPNPGATDMTQVEGDMLGALYLDAGLLMTKSGSMPILAGSCVGGGTTINWTTSLPLPEQTRAEWDQVSGLSLFSSRRFADSLDRVAARLHLSTRWTTPGVRDQILERGCRALGWHVEAQPRNVTDCLEGLECGYCGYGCRHGAKNSTAETYLRDAVAGGARLVPQCDVERVTAERGKATGVIGTVSRSDGASRRLTVRAKVVVVAAGAIYTPALLGRSGLSNPRVGRGLRLHPVSAVMGVFPERVEGWSGALQTRFSNQFADQNGGFGARLETGPTHYALAGSALGWEGATEFRQELSRFAHISHIGILLRDRDAGRVAVGRDGRPRVHYEVSQYDAAHMRAAVLGAAEILAAAGATEVFTIQTPPVRVRPGRSGWLDEFTRRADTVGYGCCRMSYISFHQLASAAMGNEPASSVVGEMGETHDVRGLFVADGSTFPTSSGVNPMVTIMAIADHVARGILERR